ncbi:MAG: hypothetical protein QME45_04380 [Clostridiales bacterium]|nr:hypothetical protein [Clostridiales bacterium]
MNILMMIPGFRSGKLWKKIIAIVYYAITIISLFSLGFGIFLILFSLPFLIFYTIDLIGKIIPAKKALPVVLAGIILMVIGFNMQSRINNSKSDNKTAVSTQEENTKTEGIKNESNETKLTTSDLKLLKGSYKNFEEEQRTQFAEIEEKYDKLSENDKNKIKDDFDRLSKERDKQVAEWQQEEKKRTVKGTATNLGAGTFTAGKDVQTGTYDVTATSGSGNFIIHSDDGTSIINEVLGSPGVNKVRVVLPDSARIQISGINKVHFTPVTSDYVTDKQQVILYSRYWLVGQDIAPGRYKACNNKSSSSNLIVYDSSGMSKTNEIISNSSDIGVKEVTFDLENDDLITIGGSNGITFMPQ